MIKRQIQLPLAQAIEIAWKNIRLRLGRSLLVTSGIVLAIAFFVSIQTSDAILRGMREWIEHAPAGELAAVQQLETSMRARGVATTAEEIADANLQRRWIVGLALLVAFVGILNAMLMSVTERFREIGTMKCLGALDGFIVRLFLIESFFQGIAGTIAGIFLGFMLSFTAAVVTYGAAALVNVPVGDVLAVAAMSLLIGVVLTVGGAIYPAWQAARMQPVEAMRVEA